MKLLMVAMLTSGAIKIVSWYQCRMLTDGQHTMMSLLKWVSQRKQRSSGSSRIECGSQHLPDGQAPHPISKGVPGHPTEEAHFSRLYPGCRSFGHDPKFMAIEKSRCRRATWRSS
ncbi:hypothetical protein XENOCAPTIV_004760 [Xenoophorus captivus]|uniref:Secreted protein n=1 Tax=Xenoophorus captivus TaxID=1517983 RepID=A0ABV0RNT6_9TELE